MSDATCWTMVEGAASGDDSDRRDFATRYFPVVRAYLRSRWGARLDVHELEDAVQEVFLECLRSGGALEHLQRDRGDGFRAYLYGVSRNVALRYEEQRRRRLDAPASVDLEPDMMRSEETSHSRVFDRAWARAILREALERMAQECARKGEAQRRRAELLRLRFRDGHSVHDIAAEWEVERGFLHHELRRALRDFSAALTEVVAFHHPGAPERVARECRELLELAS